MYGLAACALVAGALIVAAAVVAARHSTLIGGPLKLLILAAYCVLILVFMVRGLAPYVSPVFVVRARPPILRAESLAIRTALSRHRSALGARLPGFALTRGGMTRARHGLINVRRAAAR